MTSYERNPSVRCEAVVPSESTRARTVAAACERMESRQGNRWPGGHLTRRKRDKEVCMGADPRLRMGTRQAGRPVGWGRLLWKEGR